MGRDGTMTIGVLATRAGVSVRTLRYYDEIGLLAPGRHTAAGYRLYGAGDVARLQQIRSLQGIGFSLDEIQNLLRDPAYSPLRTVELHLERVRDQTRSLHSKSGSASWRHTCVRWRLRRLRRSSA